jgi:hypothetical protein
MPYRLLLALPTDLSPLVKDGSLHQQFEGTVKEKQHHLLSAAIPRAVEPLDRKNQ